MEYDDILFATHDDAQAVIDRMREIVNCYGHVTVSDMYDLADIPFEGFTDLGWNNMNGVKVVSKNNGFTISFPLKARNVYTNSKTQDNVNHPSHYMSYTGLETIDVIEAFTSDLTGMDAVCTANVIKYICRWKHKNGLEDLKKAQWYLNRLIEDNKPIERKSN